MFNTLAWVAWLAAAVVPAFTVRNPFYLALILGAGWVVYQALGRSSPLGRSWGAFFKIGLFLVGVSVVFNALSNHFGRLVLFRLPDAWPIAGGAITLESVAAGAANGLALLALLVVFAAFNAVVDHYQLLRATPAFLFQAGVVVSIAVTFVPQMVASAAEIRQAQRIRGHRFRGLRDLLPLILPLLATSLERAIQLAETMEARGFAGTLAPPPRARAVRIQAGLLAALLGMLAGLFLVAYRPGAAAGGWALVALGAAGLMVLFWDQGRTVRRTRYRRQAWAWRDTGVVVAAAATLAVVLAGRLLAPGTLGYNPYPPGLLLPPFDPLVGVGLMLLAAPAFLGRNTDDRA